MRPDFGQMFDFNGDGHVSDFEKYIGFTKTQNTKKEREQYDYRPNVRDKGRDDNTNKR